MKAMRKIVSAILAGLMSVMMITPAFAVDKPVRIVEDDMLEQVNYTLSESEQVVTVSEIDRLYDERLKATAADDIEEYNRITAILRSYGVREISYEEAVRMTGEVPSSEQNRASFQGITYETYDTTYLYNNKNYEIRRILATPSSSRTNLLCKKGSVEELENRYEAEIKAMQLYGIVIDSLIGEASDKLSGLMSVFDGLLVLGEDFNRSDVVYDIVADYDWMTLEGCSFILVREYGSNNSFVLRGLYHKAFGELIMVIQDFTVESGQDFESASKVLQVDGEATPVNYNNVREAVKGFVNGRLYQSSITDITFEGLEGQTIERVSLANPRTPSEAGY